MLQIWAKVMLINRPMKASNNHNLHSEIQIINEVSHVDSARNNETRSA